MDKYNSTKVSTTHIFFELWTLLMVEHEPFIMQIFSFKRKK